MRFLRFALACTLALVTGSAAAVIQDSSTSPSAPPSMLSLDGAPAYSPTHEFHSLGFPVQVNVQALRAMAAGSETVVSLPNGQQLTIVLDLVQDHGEGITSFVGHLKGRGNDYRAIVTIGPSGTFGSIHTPDGEFRLVPGEGHDWLIDMSAEQAFHGPIMLDEDTKRTPTFKDFPAPQTPEIFTPVAGLNTAFVSKAAPTAQYGVDIMFVVTQGFASHLGANLMTRLNNLVTSANTAYADSEVGMTMRMVGVTVVNFSDSSSDDNALDSISPGCTASNFCGGAFDAATFGAIETQRAANGADVVAFMRDGSSFGGSGLAWIGQFSGQASVLNINDTAHINTVTATNPTFMYSVTTGCVLGCDTVFIHEVGHNMGNQHDRDTALWQANSNLASLTEPYAYGYARCDVALTCVPGIVGSCTSQPECSTPASAGNNVSEIMAYFQSTTTKALKFSNPNVSCFGALGVAFPCGVAGTIDAARAMNERRGAISKIKGTVQSPPLASAGALQFTSPTFSVAESAGSVIVTVSRVGGSTGAVSVSYTMSNGTATAGSDYTSGSGTLTWAAGDIANKTITIPILNDAVTEGNETFNVTLSAPVGAFLGSPSTTTVSILEPWPPGGTIPSGFTTVSGAAWATASDTSNDGDGVSLKSGAIAFSSGVPAASTLQYSGTLVAGTVSFAYKVNSYPSNGFFEFLVDGTVVKSDSGDSGWVNTSVSITSGTHTLQWRYRPTLSFPCGAPGVTPAPPQGTACADRAWIDSVSFPAAAPPANPPHLSNISTRMQVLTGNNVLIGGFVIGGSTPKTVAIVATGPSLAQYGITNPLANPTLQLVRSSDQAVLATNDDWGTATNASQIQAAGFAPSNALESAIMTTLSPGAYTAIVSGVGGGTGVGIVAVYEVDHPEVPLTNISTRGQVLAGNDVMIGGFVVTGTGNQNVVVVATGPSLTQYGIANALANPTLTVVRSSDQSVVATNDDWGSGPNAATIQSLGFAPTNAFESALYLSLPPGAYTAIVSGVGGGTGVGIVAVYTAP